MPNFPTLSRNPSFPLEEIVEENTIRSNFEAGYELTRPRFTRMRKTFSVKYELLTNTDKQLIDNFYVQMKGGSGSFTWTNPITAVNHTVRFAEPPKFEYTMDGYWNVEIKLREL